MDDAAAAGTQGLDDLVERLERYAGECTGAEPPTVGGGNRGCAIAFYDSPAEDIVTAVSNGPRFQSIRTVVRQELALVVAEGEDALWERWVAADTDVLDVTRASAV